MSGEGKRFKEAGYSILKPLIEVDGKSMLAHVIDLFPGVPHKNIHLIAQKEHCLRFQLEAMWEGINVHEINGHSLGPVYAVSQILSHIPEDEEVIVSYCDYGTVWDFEAFLVHMRETGTDGGIAAYRGFHPHMLGTDNYAFLRLNENGDIAEVREKEPFTEDRMSEFASNGTYYFRKGSIVREFFQRVLKEGSIFQKNGEFYVSLVYNALIESGLRVRPFEIQKMLQWGTPKDVEEYNVWSRHFQKAAMGIQIPTSCATLVLPLAGKGSRFQMQGYSTPKPLLDVNGKPMIVQAVQSIPTCNRNVFVCLDAHLNEYPLQETLESAFLSTTVVGIPETTEGQACTCDIGIRQAGIQPSDPILISACDNGVDFDAKAYEALESDPTVDVIVWSFTNNPTSKRFPHMYAWMDVSEEGDVRHVSVKKYLEGATHCIIGTMFFRRASLFQEGFADILATNTRTNGEFYVDDILNGLIAKGYKVKAFPVDAYICWGTPTDYQIYQYWLEHFTKVWGIPRQLYCNNRKPMSDIFCITSVLNTGANPWSYTGSRSKYSMEERYQQSLITIKSIREKMPKETCIIFAECSNIPESMEEVLKKSCDIFFQFKNKPEIADACLNSNKKGHGELLKTKEVITYILENKIQFNRFFKISGRYFLNDSFNASHFSDTDFTFRTPFPNSSCHPTVLYSVGYENKDAFLKGLKQTQDDIERGVWLGYEYMLPLKLNPCKSIQSCGVSGYVGFDGVFYEDK